MYRVDLHTHSTASPDGGITARQYHKAIDSGILDCIAITDHNRIDFALQMQQELGERIIVGEEIMTTHGELIGLFLTEAIPAGLRPTEVIQRIREQGGLVYVPHPFETVRKGIHPAVLDELVEQIDVIEICNGRAFVQNFSQQTVVWAKFNNVIGAASSDAHGFKGLGQTYTRTGSMPTRDNLLEQLLTGTPITARASLRSLLYPKYYRMRKRLRGHET